MIAMQRNDMGMVWEVQSGPYLTHIYGKTMYFVKIHTLPKGCIIILNEFYFGSTCKGSKNERKYSN